MRSGLRALLLLLLVAAAAFGCSGDEVLVQGTPTATRPPREPTWTPIPSSLATATADARKPYDWPIKVGVLHPTTGPWTFDGVAANDGIKLYLDALKYTVAGRPVQLIFEDTEGKPDVALLKARKLVEGDNVEFLVGPLSDLEAQAVKPYVEERQVPTIVTQPDACGLTSTYGARYFFRLTGACQAHAAAGWYAAKRLNYRRVVLVANDYAEGRDAAAEFKRTFQAAGGQVVGEVPVPLGADPGPYLELVRGMAGGADAVVAQLWGNTGPAFVQAYSAAGLKGRMPLLVWGPAVEDGPALTEAGEAAVGVLSYSGWALRLENPQNQQFLTQFRAQQAKDPLLKEPAVAHVNGWMEGQAVGAVIEALRAKTENPVEVARTLAKLTLDTPRGPVSFDRNQGAVVSVYLRRVDNINGVFGNVVIDRVENVNQGWQPPE